MKATVIETAGADLDAIIEVDGHQLHVLDSFSEYGRPTSAGSTLEASFAYIGSEEETWEDIFKGNPDRKKAVEHLGGGRYIGFGQIIGVDPVVADFGLFTLEDVVETHDLRCVGEHIRIMIERLDAYTC